MLRLCLVTGEYPPQQGGVADYARCLAEGLGAAGLTVDVLTRRLPAARSERRGSQRFKGGGRLTVYRPMGVWRWGTLPSLERMTQLTRPDVLHIQYQTAAFQMLPAINFVPWWLGWRTAVRTAVTYHDLRVPYLLPKATRLRRWVTRRPARDADLTIATNRADYEALLDNAHPRWLELVPIGSNVADAPPDGFTPTAWRRAAGIDPEADLIGYFGMLNASKGARTLVGALEALRRDGREVRLVMIGARTGASDPTNADYLAQVEADLAAAGLDEHVVWTGHLPAPEVSAWLRAADVIALPYADGASYRRGSLLAALAHGRPTVTTRPAPSGGPLPALEDGVAARLVPPRDPAALADAIAALLDDPALAERLGRGAREVASAFRWEAIVERHVALYRRLAGQPPIAPTEETTG